MLKRVSRYIGQRIGRYYTPPICPRLILVVVAFPKLSETFIVNKFLGLLAHGYDVHIVCQQFQHSEWQHFPQLDTYLQKRIHAFWPREPRWLAWFLLVPALLWGFIHNATGCWRYLRLGWQQKGIEVLKHFYLDMPLIVLKPDIVHFTFGALAVEQTHLKKWLNCRLTASFRGYDLNYVGLETEGYYQAVWDEMDGLHFLGEDLWQRAQRRGCPPHKFHVLIPPAIDTTFFTPARHKDEGKNRPLRILSIGRLEWKKGYEYSLQAIKHLTDHNIQFEYRIIGDGPYRGPLAFLQHKLELTNTVHFLGAQPHREIIHQLVWADVFLHAAVSEGFCNAVLEAQAMQIPVVCTDADGLSENVANGKTGYIVPRRHPAALAEKILFLARHPNLRHQMGQAGHLRVKKHFQAQDQTEAFHQFYYRVLNQKSSY